MSLFSWVESRIHTFRWYDISLIKLAAAAFALLIAKLWPPLLSLEWHIYLIIAVLASAPVCIKILCRDKWKVL